MSRSLIRGSLTGVAVVALLAAGCGDDDDDAATDTTETTAADQASEGEEMGDILEVATSEGDLNTFLGALDAAGIMDGLHGDGPFTVFIPTDEAFASYFEEAGMSQAEAFGDQAALQDLLNYHIVNMSEMEDQVMSMDGQSFTTAQGEPLDVAVEGEELMVGGAMIERGDLEASNGVIHVVDHVLVPPSMDDM